MLKLLNTMAVLFVVVLTQSSILVVSALVQQKFISKWKHFMKSSIVWQSVNIRKMMNVSSYFTMLQKPHFLPTN